ncbi:hypothetical protein [Pseudomonas sp. GXZC]|uniref:hypothetical protein n=1 Tax=Pseudomonas sp. GXZC TaxID=3003351 RepID=UPI0022AB024A|nr:hypothetical protein [Pseudomonas sp. GXZC]WAT32128.1 hypothetical protein OZ428_34265 [Pseudomonas sp. GXZC]
MRAEPVQLSMPKGFFCVADYSNPLQNNEAYLAVGFDGVVDGGCFTESPETPTWFRAAADVGARILRGPRESAKTMLGVSLAYQGMLLASKNGNISASKLLSETDRAWTLEVEKRSVRVSKSGTHQRAFRLMSDALTWAGGDQDLIDHFLALEAEKSLGGQAGTVAMDRQASGSTTLSDPTS